MFDESALPDWLRAAAQPAAGGYAPMPNGMAGGTPSGFAPQPPASYAPAPFPPAQYSPAPYAPPAAPSPFQAAAPSGFANGPANGQANGAMPGPSLFDAAALPSWLGGTASPSTPMLQEMPTGASGLAANTLVDPNVLPQWMRDARSPQAEPAGPQAASTVSEWLANPVTDEPLPGFLDQIYSAADVPRLDQAGPSGMLGEPIVDASALPAWLRAPAGQGASQGMYPAPAPNGAPMPPPIAPAGPGGFGSGGFGSGGFSAPDAPPMGGPLGDPTGDPAAGPLFSARDLVEPDALPAWAQQGQGQNADQAFGMVRGDAGDVGDAMADWPAAQPGFVPQTAQSAPGAPPLWADQGEEPAFMVGDGASQPGRSWPPRGDRPSIPVDELPSWLREGQPAAAAMDGSVDSRSAPSPPDGYAGFEEFQGFDAGDMPMDPMDMPPSEAPQDGPGAEHYADRFGSEMPGGTGRFGYEYDYGQAGEMLPPDAAPAPPSGKAGKAAKGGKRKGFFRRR